MSSRPRFLSLTNRQVFLFTEYASICQNVGPAGPAGPGRAGSVVLPMKVQNLDSFEGFADDEFDVKAWVDEQVGFVGKLWT